MTSSSPQESDRVSLQTLIMGIGALIIVFLTVMIAIFLAARDLGGSPAPETTPSPDGATAVPAIATVVSTPTLPAVDEATDTPVSSNVVSTPTNIPATPTTTPILPSATFTTVPTMSPPTPTTCTPRADWYAYTIESGDTLQSLANRTNTSAEYLRTANCLDNGNLSAGQLIRLPSIPPTLTPIPSATSTSSPTPVPTSTFTSTLTPTPFDVTIGTPTPTTTNSLPTDLGSG